MDKNLTNEMFFRCLDEHASGFYEYCVGELKEKDLTYEEIFECAMKGDFEDKGFTESEIAELYTREVSNATAYKFIAYWIALFNEPDTYEEWVESIREDAKLPLTEDECKFIWDIREKEIDY